MENDRVMNRFLSKIGPVVVDIEVIAQLADRIKLNLFDKIISSDSLPPDIKIVVHDFNKPVTFRREFAAGKGFLFNENSFSYCSNYFSATVKNCFSNNSTIYVDIYPNYTSSTIDYIKMILEKLYLSQIYDFKSQRRKLDNIANSIFSYSLFWFVLHCALQKHGASFLHAASLDQDGKSILLAGAGGSGKTSTAIRLLEGENCKYLAEDFTIISKSGEVFFNPKTMTIYATDLRGNPKLFVDYANKHLSNKEKDFWFSCSSRKKANPMKKVPPSYIFSADKLAVKSSVDKVFFISRGIYECLSFKKVSSWEMANRCLDTSFRELKDLVEIISQGRAVAYEDTDLPSIENFRENILGTYLSAFENASCQLLLIPEKIDPEQVVDFLNVGDY